MLSSQLALVAIALAFAVVPAAHGECLPRRTPASGYFDAHSIIVCVRGRRWPSARARARARKRAALSHNPRCQSATQLSLSGGQLLTLKHSLSPLTSTANLMPKMYGKAAPACAKVR